MPADKIYIALSLEVDVDQPVADLVYDGQQWARVALGDGDLELTVYGSPANRLPLDDALASLNQARARLLELSDGTPWPRRDPQADERTATSTDE
jgi:hypothetical protein